ncbi:MAG TPA: hypothetical protein VF713_02625 [Thermoanaerobaculia bacterium]
MSRSSIAPFAVSKLFRGSNRGSDLLVGREDEIKALDAAWSVAEKKNVVTIVAWGGVGKTSLVARWAASTLAKEDHGGIERYFDWSFYSQGTRTEGDATGADKAASADIFIKEALEFFGDPGLAATNAGAWQKGERLARLVAEHRTLLILDGLEPLQDARSGELRDEAVRSLVRGLAADNRGLCLITTRQQLPEISIYHQTSALELALGRLSKEAGAELLRKLGVNGTRAEREQLAADVNGHALTLTLLGKYIAEAHGGDIRKRDLVSLTEADYEETSGHAFHVMEAYERWLEKDGRHVELGILRLLGLFDRPATPDCVSALRNAAIPGLTGNLSSLTDAHWNLAVRRLVHLGLIEEQPWESRRILGYNEEEANKAANSDYQLGEPKLFESQYLSPNGESLDAHPLIREYFGRRLRETAPAAWRAAHSRLFEHLRGNVPYWPEGLDGLQPLYQAVAHGCQSGRYEETCAEVYRYRILRGISDPHGFYSSDKLGAIGADLAAVGCFFLSPWTRPAPELGKADQAWLLHQAAYRLSALGRLTEAREPMRTAMERYMEQGNWKQAAICASNVSGLDLTLGDVGAAVRQAEQSVAFADRVGDAFERFRSRATHADALHQAGRAKEARTRFEEAERLKLERKPIRTAAYSMRGFRFSDLLLADVERAAWHALLERADPPALSGNVPPLASEVRPIPLDRDVESSQSEMLQAAERRAADALEIVLVGSRSLLSIALNHLTIGRTSLYRAVLEPLSYDIRNPELPSHIDAAVHGFRQANLLHHLPSGLLTRAWLRALLGQSADAESDFTEAQQIAKRGPMPLHLADVHLHRARLFFRDDLEVAREDLKRARALIERCGYLRRMPELEDAEKVIFAVK